MEIDKILFGQLSETKGIDATFEDLDVNNDGRITSADMDLAQNDNIKKSISNILYDVDEDNNIVVFDESEEFSPEAKTGGILQMISETDPTKTSSKKTLALASLLFAANTVAKAKEQEEEWYDNTREQSARDGIPVTDKEHFQEDVLNSTGVTYVVMGYLGGCSHCNELEESLAQIKDDLKGVCNIYNMSWGENTELCRDLAYNQAGVSKPASFPCVLTFYNGKLVKSTPVKEVTQEIPAVGGGVYEYYKESTTALARWTNTTHYYDYVDEVTGKLKSCRELVRDERGCSTGLKWTHKPQLLEDIIADVKRITSEPNVVRDSNGQLRTTAERFDDDVKKSKGTTYVVMGCIGCNSQLMSTIRQNQSKLNGVANIFQIDWEAQNNTALCRKIAHEMGGLPYPVKFPCVAKFVDGEFVEIIPNTTGSTSWRDDAIQALIDNAEGIPMLNGQNTASTEGEKVEETSEAEESTQLSKSGAAKVKTELKNKLKTIKNNINEKEFWKMQIQNKIDDIKAEYEEEKTKTQKTQGVQGTSSKFAMDNLKSRENIYSMQLDAVDAELRQLNLMYYEIAEQLK